ncbi:glycosyltransferase [Bifidobacterium saeculare]|uniref:glycosyltransferase n=1 Tax=Bifidobacterium pullorum TaxID=78448 RepID=UPI0018764747|nr:glycosyltransferase [Bifidobacterium pullorum]MBE5064727.1 glycosyltransferase [Bifidobacterium pullorum subsp. saeculare]
MTKILFTVNSLNLGGIQHVTALITDELTKRGNDVTLFCNDKKKKDFFYTSAKIIRPKRTVMNLLFKKTRAVIRRYICKYLTSNSVFELLKIIQRNNYDYVVLNPEYYEAATYIKKKKLNTKVILWIHNNYDMYMKSDYYFSDKQNLIKAIQVSDGLVCLEKYTAKKWKAYNKNVTIIHNPISIDSKGIICDLSSSIISCASRVVIQQKGLDYLIEIAKEIPNNWIIQFAGSGPDEDKFHSLVKAAHVENKIIFCGKLTPEQLIDFYSRSSIFLMTSRWEGFPLVAGEAMSFGLPIVGFDIPALEEVTENGKYGILAQNSNISDLKYKLKRLIGDIELRKKYSSLSYKRVKTFSVEHIIPCWEKLFLN